ncbi:type II toxin-antitoxin system RelB/DinJ family antitoxin [Lacticaseibacillus sharpeae]|uniref:Uncharacterized protein n=1 Tax=Lacticaseibacillus sharpeae JCM 1186 = DSM 20505 TaxID=1291052 RepID=A0A0R1ZK91_9LACO|nr:type II toxin-antitoxin system RelB/DinJ family antitoxin [Lacticaseibacillus sharpeae]KRM55368.1 hypothetical protein FC18_GL001401 [Lacticaseibacillus sharpeae JCM 1186 = DSM 20505]
MTSNDDTKTITVKVNRELADQVEITLKNLGITQTALINLLYKKVAVLGKVPFALKLTDAEVAQLDLEDAVKDISARTIDNPDEFDQWLNED